MQRLSILFLLMACHAFCGQKFRKELSDPFRKWLDEDVAYIITDEERQAWNRLSTGDEREQFIEQFWLRRDPTPDTQENEYKEEHYRRIAYANERFPSGIPGWKTDRGHIYIAFGPPDEIESHPSGGSYERPYDEGGGRTSVYPFEKWRYRWIEGVGTDIGLEFVDKTMTGEYRFTIDPSNKDALLMVPGTGLTLMEEMGMSSKGARVSRPGGVDGSKQFDRLDLLSRISRPPAVKFKDLEAAVNSSVRYDLLPVQVRTDYLKVTAATVQANVTLQFDKRDLQFQTKDGVPRAAVNLYGRITSMSRRVVNRFEAVITVDGIDGSGIYQRALFLPPGTYRMTLAAKDVIGGALSNIETVLQVPRYDDETLSCSSLILADLVDKVPTRSIGTGQFVIGGIKVRPRPAAVFDRNEKLWVYLQVYNIADGGAIEYQVFRSGGRTEVMAVTLPLENAVAKDFPLQKLEPGQYTLQVSVIGRGQKDVLLSAASFTVR